MWLTPWYDNWNGVNNCEKPWCPSTYYHGYHTTDYYGVEDHFGDLRMLRELVGKAHALGIKVIQDQVANHIGSHHPWANEPPLDDWFHGTLQNHLLEKFQNSVLLSPHANQEEVRNTLEGWFSDDMPDMNQDEPEVARYEIQNAPVKELRLRIPAAFKNVEISGANIRRRDHDGEAHGEVDAHPYLPRRERRIMRQRDGISGHSAKRMLALLRTQA